MIIGHSGCVISVKNGILEKSSSKNYSADRLLLQAEKQSQFRTNNQDDRIIIPEIFDVAHDGSSATIKMEYVNAIDVVDFLGSAEKKDLDFLLDVLLDFVLLNIYGATRQEIPFSVVDEKYQKTMSSVKDRQDIDAVYERFPKQSLSLPVGLCHGDLTLSNVLIATGKIVMVDFLDSFIESPFADITKLRQDTNHYWSCFKCDRKHDKNKVNSALSYLDGRIVQQFKEKYFWRSYELMQFLNLVRIIPYSNQNTTQFLMRQICRI